MYGYAKRGPRIRCDHIQRLRDGFRLVRGQDNSGHTDALQHADRRAYVRAIHHMPFVVLDQQLGNHRAAGQVAQRQHGRAQSSERLRPPQVIKRGAVMQQRPERLLAQADVAHRERALTRFPVRHGRAIERQPDRQAVERLRPLRTGRPIGRERAGEAFRTRPVKRQRLRSCQHELRFMAVLAQRNVQNLSSSQERR